jgi:hypothetical protein
LGNSIYDKSPKGRLQITKPGDLPETSAYFQQNDTQYDQDGAKPTDWNIRVAKNKNANRKGANSPNRCPYGIGRTDGDPF